MKWGFIICLIWGLWSCTLPTEESMDCTRMVRCTLFTCSGEAFSIIEVEACEAERFEQGCCPVLPEVTCRCEL